MQKRLEAEGLWDWFVFPAVAYVNKSGLISATVEAMGLRTPTVLFIDDNHFNRGEVNELNKAFPQIATITGSILHHDNQHVG